MRAAFSFTSISSRRPPISIERVGRGAAAAAQLGHLLDDLEQFLAYRLDLVFVETLLQPIDARFNVGELLFELRRHLGFAARDCDLGLAARFFRLGPVPGFGRFGIAARFREIGQADGLGLFRQALTLLGSRCSFRLTPRLGDLGLAPRLRHFRLAFRLGEFRLAASFGEFALPAGFGSSA